jgi:hypothetical protein
MSAAGFAPRGVGGKGTLQPYAIIVGCWGTRQAAEPGSAVSEPRTGGGLYSTDGESASAKFGWLQNRLKCLAAACPPENSQGGGVGNAVHFSPRVERGRYDSSVVAALPAITGFGCMGCCCWTRSLSRVLVPRWPPMMLALLSWSLLHHVGTIAATLPHSPTCIGSCSNCTGCVPLSATGWLQSRLAHRCDRLALVARRQGCLLHALARDQRGSQIAKVRKSSQTATQICDWAPVTVENLHFS